MANRTTRTPQKDGKFLAELARCGLVTQAARAAGYTRSCVYVWRHDDATFGELWDDAIAEYTEGLEAEADRRAKDGVAKPVFYLGEQCGVIQQYSDTLLMFRLKALKPEVYRERALKVQLPAPAPDPSHDASKAEGLSGEALRQIKQDVYELYDDDDTL